MPKAKIVQSSIASAGTAPVAIVGRQLPEGVWLATSADVPGLVVETSTREELVRLAPELAQELIEEDHLFPPDRKLRFTVSFV